MLRIRNGHWVVVCNGAKALILANEGDAGLVNLAMRETFAAENLATAEQGTDRPGRVHQRFGPSRSAVEQTDWHDEAERAFLKELAGRLDKAVAEGAAGAIVLVAPPRAMGMLRTELSDRVGKAVSAEITKDYTGMPVSEIEKHLAA